MKVIVIILQKYQEKMRCLNFSKVDHTEFLTTFEKFGEINLI
jgi:hypothetical protein